MDQKNDEESLAALVKRGGVYDQMPGDSLREILAGMVEKIPLPPDIDREKLLRALLEREALMSTGAGKGIALPHPRNPAISDERLQLVAVAFPARPVDWKALDNEPVHTVLLIISASARQHLRILSKLNFLCQQENFYHLLQDKASLDKITQAIREAENAWEKE
jgi:PTS system nitrogen regulatory IIA component